ncbi:helix-turn-helix domain-containing protein [Halobellus litoreus]|uniref:Helix-turn-helix domain-containing protein n=1 Tax=Halobellus litoreus TaxID=755310 RepID=A0ABD6DXY7_9EURY
MYEATLQITGHSSYAEATAGTSATIDLWCNQHCDLLHVSREPAMDIAQKVETTVGIQERLENREETVLVTNDCLREHEDGLIEPFLDRHGCLLLYPLHYEDGEKVCRILSISPTALTECFHDLVEADIPVTVKSKRKLGSSVETQRPLLAPHDIVPTLTDRQSEVIHHAFENGYYEIPRGITTEEIATEMGVKRRTAEEHLRRAENKLLASVIDFLN